MVLCGMNGARAVDITGDMALADGDYENMTAGTVDELTGRINGEMSGGSITAMNYGSITTMNGDSSVGVMKSGSIGIMDDGSEITKMDGGVIEEMKGNASQVIEMNGGTIEVMNEGSVLEIKGGSITMMNDGSRVYTLSESGVVETMNGGRVESMNGGSITTMNNNSFVGSVYDALIVEMNDDSVVDTIDNGVIETMNDNSRVERMRHSSRIGVMNGGTIESMEYGDSRVDVMNGGVILDMDDAEASIGVINSGTLGGEIKAGSALTVSDGGLVMLSGGSKNFARTINSGGTIQFGDYNYDPTDAVFNLTGGNGAAVIDTARVVSNLNANGQNRISYAGKNATIANFGGTGTATFVVDFDAGGMLTINNVTGNTNHLVDVLGSPVADTVFLTDLGATINLSLVNGDIVDGAYTYGLVSDDGAWSLARQGMSGGALAAGGFASGILANVYGIQNALHKRLGDIRGMDAAGMWVRSYTHHVGYDDLVQTKIHGYGVEAGVDGEIAAWDGGRLVVGAGAGINYARAKIDDADAQADYVMPYGGVYATALFDNGIYVDATGRYLFADVDGGSLQNKVDFDSNVAMASIELGYQYRPGKTGFVLEPHAELSYAHIGGSSFDDGKMHGFDSLLSSVGGLVRYNLNATRQVYVKANYLYEFKGEADIKYSGVKYTTGVKGHRGEAAIGFVSDFGGFDMYGELGYQYGQHDYQSVAGNAGVRFAF